jgi:hypothetical protein
VTGVDTKKIEDRSDIIISIKQATVKMPHTLNLRDFRDAGLSYLRESVSPEMVLNAHRGGKDSEDYESIEENILNHRGESFTDYDYSYIDVPFHRLTHFIDFDCIEVEELMSVGEYQDLMSQYNLNDGVTTVLNVLAIRYCMEHLEELLEEVAEEIQEENKEAVGEVIHSKINNDVMGVISTFL